MDHVTKSDRGILLLLGLTTVARLIFAASFPPLDDEAYYWTWAHHLAWGYPDHPPMIAFILRGSIALAGDTPLGIRMGPVLLALGTPLLLWDLGRQMFGTAVGRIAALWFQLIPALALGAIFAAPDAPLGFFWILTLWSFWRALTSGTVIAWLLTGLALGMAMMSKLTAAFLALALPGFLLTSPMHRRWLRRWEPYGAALVSVLVVLPAVLWNADHGWVMIRKSSAPAPWTQLGSGGLDFLAYTAGQLVYYGPVAAVLLLLALAASVRWARRGDNRFALVTWASIPLIGVNWLASAQGIPKPHWPAPGYLIALLPAAALWLQVRARQTWRALAGIAVGLNLLIVVAIYVLPFRPPPSFAGQLWGWDQVAAKLDTLINQAQAGRDAFILSASYQTASQIDYHTHGRFVVTTAGANDAFAVRRHPDALMGRDAVFINDVAGAPGVPLALMFERVERLPDFEVVHGGQVVRRFAIYRCTGFKSLPVPD